MKERVGEIAKISKEKVKRITALAAIGGLGLLASGCSVDFPPHSKSEEVTTHTIGEARKTALTKYRHGLKKISPAGKFAMQYLSSWNADVIKTKKSDYEGETWQVKDFYRFQLGNACLRGTAYDIAGGNFSVSAEAGGLFSYSRAEAEGNMPAAAANAYVDSDRPNILVIQSGHADSIDLYFDNAQGADPLVPIGKKTKDVLDLTYGCDTGLVRHATVEPQDYPPIEPQHSIYLAKQ